MIAVNFGDDTDTINKYVAEGGFTFPIVLGDKEKGPQSIFSNYRIQAFPTNYLLDAEGRVVFRDVGFPEEKLRAALAKLGVK